MEKLDKTGVDIVEQTLELLKVQVPNVFVEGKIDFDKLKVMLGAEVDFSKEKYHLSWTGKTQSIRTGQKPSTSTLRPSKEQSLNWSDTNNIYIEGDNLEVLKQLQKTYFDKIDMIYIDPPYNTGGDFVYNDDFSNTIKNYKDQTNQRMSSNPETSGRYHTDWLNMMYPRLLIAKNLLSKKGVIFISISDHEIANLKIICDEIFSESNYMGDIVWNSTKSVTNTALLSVSHTYNLVYFKDIEYFKQNRGEFRLPDDGEGFSNPDGDPRGPWKADPFQVGGWRPNQQYEIINPNTGEKYLPNSGCSWKNDYEKFKLLMEDNRIVFGKTGESGPQRKRFLSEALDRGKVVKSWWDDVETTTIGTQQLKKMFKGNSLFTNPKPVSLIERMLQLGTNKKSTILDFFSGSATTAHAVMKLNAEDGGSRKFIMVQLPEQTDEKSEAYKAGYKNICEIGKERIRRAGEQIKQELIEKKEKAGMLDENIVDPDYLDIGFKVFKLDDTNIKAWDSSAEVTKETLLDQVEVIKENRTKEDVLYEVLLKYGVFNQPVKELSINNKTMYDIGEGYMIVNLNDEIEDNDIKEITRQSPHVVIFLESGFINDNEKINAEATLKHNGIEDVKCI